MPFCKGLALLAKSLARTLGKEKNWFASSRVARVAKGPPPKSCQCFVCMGGGAANNCVSYKGSVCMHGSAAILA